VLVLSKKYYDGVVPAKGKLLPIDNEVLVDMNAIQQKITNALNDFKFREALAEAMNLARIGNKYFAETEPWKVVKTDENRVKTIMNVAVQIAANLTIAFDPFLPFSTAKLRVMMNISSFKWIDLGNANLVADEHQMGKSEVLFPKIDDAVIEVQIEKLKKATAASSNPDPSMDEGSANSKNTESKFPPMKDEIQFDDFMKMDVRVGQILSAEKHPNADKLLVLTVDTGIDQRTVVSGIAAHYSPEEVVGKSVSILLNLAPRKIRGVVSQGMILMAEDTSGKLTFITPEKEIETGSEVR
ncbi:MAG: methionine--tRNA ligase subunit beta, partial [Flavobacteriales bacterium]|nr:methionine--tRNA ligase subunit beta [Flavobacteriales bacterium]